MSRSGYMPDLSVVVIFARAGALCVAFPSMFPYTGIRNARIRPTLGIIPNMPGCRSGGGRVCEGWLTGPGLTGPGLTGPG